jgi:hypothetical protein
MGWEELGSDQRGPCPLDSTLTLSCPPEVHSHTPSHDLESTLTLSQPFRV